MFRLVNMPRGLKEWGVEVRDERIAPKEDVVYHLKVTLLEVKPSVWRRIRTPDCTLERLNETIQAAMGWEGDHLWVFEVGKREFTDRESAYELEMDDANRTTLAAIAPKTGAKFRYTYDFGDDWHHEVVVEGIGKVKVAGPSLLGGAGACPPEDVGGVIGYAEFLAVLRDPGHKGRQEWVEWGGWRPEFDAETFDASEANARLALLW